MLPDTQQGTERHLLVIITHEETLSASLETQLGKNYAVHLAENPEEGHRIMCQVPVQVIVSDAYVPEMAERSSPIFRYVAHPWKAAHLKTIIENAFGLHNLLENHQKQIQISRAGFLAAMSHELRTPLSAILGFSDLLAALITDEKQKNYLASIRSGGKRLLALVNDISDFSTIESGKMAIQQEPVSPRIVLNEVREIFSPELSKKPVEFVVTVADDVPESLLLDEKRFRQILLNLVRNSASFTEKGHISVLARQRETNGKTCDLMILVEDTGPDISENLNDMNFHFVAHPQEKISRDQGGSGLELFITRKLVKMMNGEISVRCGNGTGNIFQIVFRDVPIGQVTAQPVRPLPEPENEPLAVLEKATLLLVDDAELNRMLLRTCLKKTNIRVMEAGDGQEALMLAAQHRPDVILMDIRMPVMDGYEAACRIKDNEKLRHIPVIALTASVMASKDKNAMRDTFDGLLVKPVKPSDLVMELSRVLRTAGKRKKTSVPRSGTQTDPTRSGVSDELEPVISQLENEFMTLRDAVLQSKTFDKIAQFGEQIRAFGQAYALEMVVQFGTELVTHVENFDIDAIEDLLNGYPDIIENIRGTPKA